MIERVAKAIYISEIGSDAGWHDPRVEQNKELWLRKARAAIGAMRDATDEMFVSRIAGDLHFTPADKMKEMWQAMIDAALNPPQPAESKTP